MTLSFKDVAEILKIIDASQCEEVILDLAGVRLEVRRGASSGAYSAPASPTVRTSAPAATAALRTAPAATQVVVAEGTIEVRAPMVGTFYRRPNPQEKPFAEVGNRIKKGEPLCLIEVMKLYTTITAPADGIVEAFAVDDGALVEFDQLLVVVRAG
jgi:acetyl-CoA carboxylase biotin carboxyl carrier protein